MVTDYEGCPTTRCYPRTLLDAFPDDAVNSEWFYPPETTWQDRVVFWAGIFMWVAIGFYFWEWI